MIQRPDSYNSMGLNQCRVSSCFFPAKEAVRKSCGRRAKGAKVGYAGLDYSFEGRGPFLPRAPAFAGVAEFLMAALDHLDL
jgi:hypothetical protein